MSSKGDKIKESFASRYEGGHPMRDPDFLRRRKETMEAFGSSYDIEKAKETSRKNHGVDFYTQTDVARAVSKSSMERLHMEGRSYSGKNKKECNDLGKLRDMLDSGVLLRDIALEFSISDVTLSRWLKEYGIEHRRGKRVPKVVPSEPME